jgi:cytochrome oxidase Cu insertion factor (SCO1/SenC/PrrC family)
MRIGARARLALLASLFLVPIAGSLVVAVYFRPEPTANYGELLLPPAAITAQRFARAPGGEFAFAELRGRWVLVSSDAGACATACVEKLAAMRQVRLALGRNAGRVERVFVADDLQAPEASAMAAFEGMVAAVPPRGMGQPPGATRDREHIYLVDPAGNVMMRWPSRPDPRRMLKDLERLLKASQIG